MRYKLLKAKDVNCINSCPKRMASIGMFLMYILR